MHLSIRRVAKISQKIAEEKNDPAFFVPHNWISDLENGKSKPRLAKFHCLSLIYDCDINEILALFGLNIADLGKERGHVHTATYPSQWLTACAIRAAHRDCSKVGGNASVGANESRPSHAPWPQRNGSFPRPAGSSAGFVIRLCRNRRLHARSHYPSGSIRADRSTAEQSHQGSLPNEHDRPVYFVELRDNRYACSWCELEGSHLLLVPSPKSPISIRNLRYPHDAEIIGRVVGWAHRIAQVQPDAESMQGHQ